MSSSEESVTLQGKSRLTTIMSSRRDLSVVGWSAIIYRRGESVTLHINLVFALCGAHNNISSCDE